MLLYFFVDFIYRRFRMRRQLIASALALILAFVADMQGTFAGVPFKH